MELFTWTRKRCHGKTEGFEIIELILDVEHCLQVHHGFYFAYHNTTMRTGILNAVEKAKEFYVDIVSLTGHSTGGAMAAFCVEKVCNKSGEDPSCRRSVKGNSIVDHLVYFGFELMLMSCGDLVGSCRIAVAPRLMKYGGPDAEGNIVLSRTPVSSAIRLTIGNTNRDQII